jgi:polysaccharide pyruvyl transferase CsaB
MTNQLPRILIAGSYGHGNLGDEAILSAILTQLRSRLPDAHLQVVAGDEKALRTRFGIDTVGWADWAEIAFVLQQADLLLLGGGGIFFDYEGFNAEALFQNRASDLAHYASFPLLAALFDKPLMLYACGVGPLFTSEGREAVRLAFDLAKVATVRDAASADLLADIGVDVTRVETTADPAFALDIPTSESAWATLAELGLLNTRPILGVAPRPWTHGPSQETWLAELAAGIGAFADRENAQILLIPFHPGYDDATIASLSQKLQPRVVHTLSGNLSAEQTAAIIGACDMLVGMRFHSILFAMLAATPAVAIAYDPKVRSLAHFAGHEDLCLEMTALSDLSRVMDSAWTRRETLRESSRRTVAALKPLAEKNADLACELLTAPPRTSSPDKAFRHLLSQALHGRLKEIRALGYERDPRFWDPSVTDQWMLEPSSAALLTRVTERDEIIRALQHDLQTQVGEANSIIADLQIQMQTKVDEANSVITDLQTQMQLKVDEANHVINRLQAELLMQVELRDEVIRKMRSEAEQLRQSSAWRVVSTYWTLQRKIRAIARPPR